MLEISKYKDYLKTTEYEPDQNYKIETYNPKAIENILTSIDMLENNECLVIRKIKEKEK